MVFDCVLLKLTNIGFDLPLLERSVDDIVKRSANRGISFDYN